MEKKEMKAMLSEYRESLLEEELSNNTIKKYLNDLEKLFKYSDNEINKKVMINYREELLSKYAISSVNSYLISANRFLKWLNHPEYTVKTQRLQRNTSLDSVITIQDYCKMIDYAKVRRNKKMYYIMKVIASTGIRIGELQYITVDAIEKGNAVVFNKGKYRRIYIPQNLCDELIKYCNEHYINEGIIFYGRFRDKAITSSGVWRNLKRIAQKIKINSKNIYPHSFRHLFAKTYMEKIGDITELADILGHSRLETTWIYTQTTVEEKRNRLNTLNM